MHESGNGRVESMAGCPESGIRHRFARYEGEPMHVTCIGCNRARRALPFPPGPPDPQIPRLLSGEWRRSERLLQVVLELAAAGRVAELAESLGLDLADPLAGDVELLAHFLQGAGPTVLQSEPELQHPPLATGQ